MNSDNLNSPKRPLTSREDKLFPLPKQQEQFETERVLLGLFKQGPLETNREFAERIWKAWLEHQAKQGQPPESSSNPQQPKA